MVDIVLISTNGRHRNFHVAPRSVRLAAQSSEKIAKRNSSFASNEHFRCFMSGFSLPSALSVPLQPTRLKLTIAINMTAPLLMILFSIMATSSAFSPVHPIASARVSALHMSSAVKVPITITGDNIELTPALTDYVNLKVDRTLGKLSSVSAVSHCDVYLTVNKNPKVSK